MIKPYFIICGKYRKFKNFKISCIFLKTLGLSIVCNVAMNIKEIFK